MLLKETPSIFANVNIPRNKQDRTMNKRTLTSILLLAAVLPTMAQIRGRAVEVNIVPDRMDWNYRTGETAEMTLTVQRNGVPLRGAKVELEAGKELFADTHKQMVLKDGSTKWKAQLKEPGFYRLKAKTRIDGREYSGICTVGFSPEQIKPFAQNPADFDTFWKRALQEARKNNLDPRMRLLPERSTELDDVFEVSFVNNTPESRIYGILTVPKQTGEYPALLRVPGAGVRPYSGDTYTAPGRCIVLEIGIHGIPVTMEQKVYDLLRGGALDNYWAVNLDEPERNYYKRVITGAVRAVDFIARLPKWNHRVLGVTGASQGGFLSLATAALDDRVTFLAAVHDAMCDYEAELHGVAGGWPHYFIGQKDSPLVKARIEGARYYDGVNFARRCKQPAWFSFGYNDEAVPPTSSYGVYNIYPGTKTLSVYPTTGHFWLQEQWDEWQSWIKKHLGL